MVIFNNYTGEHVRFTRGTADVHKQVRGEALSRGDQRSTLTGEARLSTFPPPESFLLGCFGGNNARDLGQLHGGPR